jgi:hypothetical protein
MSEVKIVPNSVAEVARPAAIWDLGNEHPYFGPLNLLLHQYFSNRPFYLHIYLLRILVVKSLDDVRPVEVWLAL